LALAATLLLLPGTAHALEAQEIRSGPLSAKVSLDPFGISFRQAGGEGFADLPGRSLGFAVGARAEAQVPYLSYGALAEGPEAWFRATRAVPLGGGRFLVRTNDPLGRTFRLTVTPDGSGAIAVRAELSNAAAVTATRWSFEQAAGERFLGFGERSDGADQTGRVVENWTEEGPWSTGEAKPVTDPLFGDRWQGPPPFDGTNFPIPWLLSSRGYGVLLDTSYPSRFSLGAEREGIWEAETRDLSFGFRAYAGPTPADALARFSASTGRQPDPAEWFFGPWYEPASTTGATGSSGTEAPDEAELARLWREEWDVPLTVAQSYTHYLPCGSHLGRRETERERARHYHEWGYMATTYVNSFVCQDHPGGAYEVGDERGYFVKTRAGTTYPVPYIAWYRSPWHGVVDFTNPEAGEWWGTLADDALEDGYDGWMEDFGEYVPPDGVMSDGRSGLAAHNEYCTLYHRASDDLIRAQGPDGFAQFVRCGYTGTARHARLVWGGDPTEDYSKADGLAAAVSQGISMGLSGVAYWGSDIGGFHAIFTDGPTDEELLTRWLEFGAFSGIMRTQTVELANYVPGAPGGRAQVWDEGVRPTWRKYAKLRTQLFPYIWGAARDYRERGVPIMRHLALAYPGDPGVYSPEAEYQYLFGPDLLVAPVIEEGARSRRVYLPPGQWVDFWQAVSYDEASGTFERVGETAPLAGGRIVEVDAPLDRIPIFVRAGACLPILPPEVDTLAEVGEKPGLVHLSDVAGRQRILAFGGECADS